VKDPHEVVKAGDVVRVRVVEVDVARKRIGLSMRRDPAPGSGGGQAGGRRTGGTPARPDRATEAREQPPGALGQALLEALKRE
jgi:protein Tex